MSQAIADARALLQTNRVFAVALAASREAAMRFSGALDVRYHLRAESDAPVRIEGWKDVPIEAAGRAIDIMKKRFPIIPMPWAFEPGELFARFPPH
jgi:hypothetical protein